MNLLKIAHKKISLSLILALSCFVFGIVTMSACGSAEGKTKKKKEKVVEDHEESSADEKDQHSEKDLAEKEPKKSESNKGGKDEKEKADLKDDKHADDKKAEKPPAADKLWAELMGGNKLFMKGKYNPGNFLDERPALAKEQKPNVIVLGCSDSRVPPELVFGENTGDLFVVRDAGNIVDEITLGSMEYAVEHLHSSVIVVLGHESCGAVAATVAGEKMPTANLQAIVDTISPAFADSDKCEVGGKMNTSCVELNVQQTAKQLTTKSSVLRKAVAEERLTIFKAIYRLETGEVARLE
jgi:carbonic anhydrase